MVCMYGVQADIIEVRKMESKKATTYKYSIEDSASRMISLMQAIMTMRIMKTPFRPGISLHIKMDIMSMLQHYL